MDDLTGAGFLVAQDSPAVEKRTGDLPLVVMPKETIDLELQRVSPVVIGGACACPQGTMEPCVLDLKAEIESWPRWVWATLLGYGFVVLVARAQLSWPSLPSSLTGSDSPAPSWLQSRALCRLLPLFSFFPAQRQESRLLLVCHHNLTPNARPWPASLSNSANANSCGWAVRGAVGQGGLCVGVGVSVRPCLPLAKARKW